MQPYSFTMATLYMRAN